MTHERPPLPRYELLRIREGMTERQLVAFERGYGPAHDGDETLDVPLERWATRVESDAWITAPLSAPDLEFVDAYARMHDTSRAVVIRYAIRALRRARRAAHRAMRSDDESLRCGPRGGGW